MTERIVTYEIPFELGVHELNLPEDSEFLWFESQGTRIVASVIGAGPLRTVPVYLAMNGPIEVPSDKRTYLGSAAGPTGHVHVFLIRR